MKKMNNMDSAHNNHWKIAEVVFGAPFLGSIALHYLLPFSLPPGILRQIFLLLGIVLIIIGIWLIVLARREFAHFRQPTDPGQPTSKLIKTGVFSLSRNPLYLGSAIVFLGIALAMNMLWTLGTLLASIILCLYILIRPEEKYLAAKFGDEYRDYMATVHRWLGRS